MPKVKISDLSMHFESVGKGEPLLLLHGLGSSAKDWEMQVGEFSQKYRVISLDMRGHGQTDKPKGPYSIKQFADDCVGLLKEINIQRVHILGLSMGCAVGYELAIHYPEMIGSFIGVNMAPSLKSKSLRGLWTAVKRLLIIIFGGMRAMGRIIAKAVFPQQDQLELRILLEERIAQNEKRPYIASLLALKDWSVVENLHKIQCPTLIVASEFDYSAVETKQAAVDLIPNSKLHVIKDARHVVPIGKPIEFNKVVLQFLAENPL